MKQVEINAEIRITYKLPDAKILPSVEDFEQGIASILRDEWGITDKDECTKVRVIVRGIDVIKENM